MIEIIFTKESVEGEPGPNFYWRGKPNDYLLLLMDLHNLGFADQEIRLNDLKYIKCLNGLEVIAKSFPNTSSLVEIKGNVVLIELGQNIWQQILKFFLGVSFTPSHDYIEFDELKLVEHANFIISSEC